MRPYAVVHVVPGGSNEEEGAFHRDGQAAYLHAIEWVVTGREEHKKKAIEILNAWANTLQELKSTGNAAQVRLEAAWVAPMFVNAAEVIRHHDGGGAPWPPDQVDKFGKMLDLLYGYAVKAKGNAGNWGASASYAMMSIGVFQDNVDRYNAGKAAIEKNIAKSIFGSGEVLELKKRDCWHPQYSLEAYTQAAEVAQSQGDTSLYELKLEGQNEPRLALGLEYVGKSLINGEGVRDCRGQRLEAGYGETAVRYYKLNGRNLPAFETAVKAARPIGRSDQFLGWNTLTHGLDF